MNRQRSKDKQSEREEDEVGCRGRKSKQDKQSEREEDKAGCRGRKSKLRPTLNPEGHKRVTKKYRKSRVK